MKPQIIIQYTTSRGYHIYTTLILKGRGVRFLRGGMGGVNDYIVTDKAMEKLQKTYTWEARF